MTPEEIVKLALEAGFEPNSSTTVLPMKDYASHGISYELERFAVLVAAHEREKQAEQEPVVWEYCPECGSFDVRYEEGRHKQCARCFQEWFSDVDYSDVVQQNLNRLYAAPVRTKDLTDDEIADIRMSIVAYEPVEWGRVFARAVIAADREKNK